MRALAFPGFLSTPGDAAHVRDALERTADHALVEVDLLALAELGSRDAALARATALIEDDDILVGYSMGARLVLGLLCDGALRRRVRGAVLVSATPGIADDDARRARADEERALGDALCRDPLAFIARWSAHPLFAHARAHPALVAQRARREALASPTWAMAWARALALFGQGASPPLWAKLARLDVELAFIAGARDERYADVAMRAAASAPRASHRVVADVGHALLAEAPDAIASSILEVSYRASESGRAQEVAHASGAPHAR